MHTENILAALEVLFSAEEAPRLISLSADGTAAMVVVRSSDFVPDGLALAGRASIADSLLGLDDYPTFSLRVDLPSPTLSLLAGLSAWGEFFNAVAREIRLRTEEVDSVLAIERRRFEEPAGPWHITGFDVYSQIVSIGGRSLTISSGRRRGDRGDLKALFLAPLLIGAVGERDLRHLHVSHAERGGHTIEILAGRRQNVRVKLNLKTGETKRLRSRTRDDA